MAERSEQRTIAGVSAWQPLIRPSQRWPHATDLTIALVSFALSLLIWAREGMSLDSLPAVLTYVCAFVGNLALLWRRSHPLQVHLTVLGASVLVYLGAMSGGLFALTFSLYSVGRHAADDRASLLAMLGGLLFVGIDSFLLNEPSVSGTLACGMAATIWYVGRRLRFRGEYLRLLEERAEYLERDRHLAAERAVAEERTRIAREMHDVVAHQLSLMTVQAGAARTVSESNPEAAREAMAAVEKAGRQAVCEMRHLLGVLRPAAAPGALDPQPGIANLPTLVDEVNAAGPCVRLRIDGDHSTLPASLALAVYRIVQEALTNVIRHAGPDVSAQVSVAVRDDQVIVAVQDNGRGTSDRGTGGGGHGLMGMRERVELLGGTFRASTRGEGGFEVKVILPIRSGSK